jgi:hypothetical protein
MRIVGVALLLFSAVLLGVGIHHLVATGTCSSTGYSSNYGPVPYCPSGTGWWFAFVFGGIIGSLIGALMAGSMGLVFAGIRRDRLRLAVDPARFERVQRHEGVCRGIRRLFRHRRDHRRWSGDPRRPPIDARPIAEAAEGELRPGSGADLGVRHA